MIPVRKDFSYPFPCYSDGVKKGEQELILTQILLLELVYTHSLSYHIDSIINTERCFTLGLDSHDEKNSTGPYLLRTSTHTKAHTQTQKTMRYQYMAQYMQFHMNVEEFQNVYNTLNGMFNIIVKLKELSNEIRLTHTH